MDFICNVCVTLLSVFSFVILETFLYITFSYECGGGGLRLSLRSSLLPPDGLFSVIVFVFMHFYI